MKKNQIVALLALVALACSPGSIARELLGLDSAVAEPSPSESPVAGPEATATLPQSGEASATRTSVPVLTLRTDLPPLALRDWPRPANDNGRCIHFLPTGYYSPRDFEIQIPRMVDLQMRWTLALYSDENQLRLAAPRFKSAGIVPVWRHSMRAHQRHLAWERDIRIVQEAGLPPYMQVYNEPDNPHEWDGRPVERDVWIGNFLQSARDIYNAGGYVGIQVLDPDWVFEIVRAIKERKGERLFGRMFFVPHPYGSNHPPNYIEDEISVLGFRMFADIFQREIGFVPPFIAGEGGWKFKETEDNRFPPIDDKLHAQYHVELFNWFRSGKLSDGMPLPDYLFAFCPWILASQLESAAWYDSFEGERTLTIQEIKKSWHPPFVRKFSWDRR